MGRTRRITDTQILDVARAAFVELGLDAKTSTIAERAGISEGTIFKRFHTKEALFLAAMHHHPRALFHDLDVMDLDPDRLHDQLLDLARRILDFYRDIMPCITLIMAHRAGVRDRFVTDLDAPPAMFVHKLTGFLTRQSRQGTLRLTHPDVRARMIIGSMHHFAFAERSGLNDVLPIDEHAYIQHVVSTTLMSAPH